jgi:hypothetical protein
MILGEARVYLIDLAEGSAGRRQPDLLGTAAIYVAFLLVALAALVARVRDSWVPAGSMRMVAAGSR